MEGDCNYQLPDYKQTIVNNALPILTKESFLGNPFSPSFTIYYLNTEKLYQMVEEFWKVYQTSVDIKDVSDSDVAHKFVEFLQENVQNGELIRLDRHKFERSYSMGFIYLFADRLQYNPTEHLDQQICPLNRTQSEPNIAYSCLQSTSNRSESCHVIITGDVKNTSDIGDITVQPRKSFRKSIKNLGKRIKRAAGRVFRCVCPCTGRSTKYQEDADI